MEAVLFYGVPQGCSMASIIALEWLGVPYRLSRIEMMEHPWPPLFARLNPLNLSPSFLTEDDQVINESMAILLHLAARDGNRLGYPQGTSEFDGLNQMLAYLNTSFFSSFGPLWMAYEMEANPPKQVMLREMGAPLVTKALAYLNSLLTDREWIDGGNKRTVADAYFAATARWAEYHGVLDVALYPHAHRHLKKLRADPAVIFADAIERQAPVVTTGDFRGHVSLGEVEPRLPA